MESYNGEYLGRADLERLGVVCGGDDVRVHKSVVLVNPRGFRLGNHVRIDPFCVISATTAITLGRYIHISAHCSLVGGGGIEIADYANISHGVRIFSVGDDPCGRHLIGPTIPETFRGVTAARVVLRRFATVCAGAVILPGVTIEEGGTVGALAFLREDVPPWTIWGGVPARQIGLRERRMEALAEELAADEAQRDAGPDKR